MTNKNLLKILFVEDLPSDADLEVLELQKGGLRFEHIRVDTRDEFIKALNELIPDIIISDYMMPSYNGMLALVDAREFDPSMPFILCTGSMNEETAVECIKAGATDYVIKEHLTRLPFAVKEALEQHRIQIEKRAAELLLKENEEKLQSIFRAAPVGIGLVVNRVFMEVNDTFCTMTGYTRKELIGKNAEMIYATNEEYESVGIEKYRQIAEKGTGSVETRFKCKDGRILNIFLSSTPLDKDDLMKGVTFTVMDITERKTTEEALRESEEKYRLLIDTANESIIVAQDGLLKFVNNITIELMEVSSEQELIGRPFPEFIHPDDRRMVVENYRRRIANKGAQQRYAFRVVTRKGAVKWVEINAVLIEWQGKPATLNFLSDITERKRAEDKLRSSEERLKILFDYAPDAYYLNDLKGNIVDGNIAAEKLLGYNKNELIGKSFLKLNLLSPKQIPRAAKLLVKSSLGQAAGPDEFVLNRRDESKVTVEIITHPVKIKGQTLVLAIARDITARRKADDSLRQSELKFKQLSENSGEWIWEIDKNGLFTYSSPVVKEMLGYEPEEIINKIHFYDFFNPALREQLKQAAFDVFTRKESFKNIPNSNLHKEGREVIFHTSGIPMFDNKGNYIGYRGVVRDITESKNAEEALRKSEEKYRRIFENVQDMFFELSIEGMMLEVSPSVELISKGQYKRDEVIGKHIYDFFYEPAEGEAIMNILLEHGFVPDVEIILKNRDGSKIPCSISLKIIFNQNKHPEKIVGSMRNITERKQADEALRESEMRYKMLFSSAAEGILVAKIETMQFLYANPALCKMFGYTEEELMRLGVKDIHPKESLDYVMAEFGAQMRGEKILASDLPCIRKDGTLFYADVHATSMVLDGFKCNVGFFIDITDQMQTHKELLEHRDHLEELVNERTEELSKAKKEAEEANKAKSEFLANMSHEIRTPMNAVLGYTELLSSMLVDQTQKDYINSIKSSGRSLLTLINDILDLSKIEAGKLEMEYEYVDTYSFFSEFERIFSLKVSEKGLKFILDITSGTPAGINIDEARVRQIVFNLIGNAIKFTSEGKIVLKVFTENPQIVNYTKEKSEELIDLIIEVQDTGIGISTELQEAIFEPFVQERDNKHRGGTGLGLTITRRLTALMDGTIHVQSKPGRGSIFTVRIPEIAYLRDFSKTTVDIQIDPSEIVFEKASILIADDVQHNRSYLRDALKNTRLKIVEAEDGITAYKLAKEIVPDLIVVDIRMPKMDGFQLLDKIKTDKKLKHIPVIAYSASVIKSQKERIHNSEFAGLLIKPVKVTELYLELMNFLPYKSIKAAEPDKSLSEVDLIGEITNLPGLIHSLETGFYTIWKTFAVRQPIGEIRDFGKSLIQLGMDHNSSILTGYGKELISAADSFNIEAILMLVEKYKGIIETLKDSNKNPNND